MNQTVSLCEFGTVERVFYDAYKTNCFQGEASVAYDPCGNMISLVAQSSGVEAWARAVDKNSTQAIGLYNPHAIEMPFVGDGTVMPPYEEPIVSPIAFTIGGSGFNVKDHLASNTDLTIAIDENGAHAYIGGDDDCGIESCGNPEYGYTCDKPNTPENESWNPYCNCVRNCFHTGDTDTQDTSYDEFAWEKWESWISVKTAVSGYLAEKKKNTRKLLWKQLQGMIDAVSTTDAESVGLFGTILSNLAEACKDADELNFILGKLIRNLNDIFAKSPWTTDNPAGESSLERFTRYTNRESDCRDLCKDLVPGSSSGGGGGFG